MSDSSAKSWTSTLSFGPQDNSTSVPVQAGDPNDPVNINVAGNMENLTLITSKETDVFVAGNMDNCGFSGQNLSASDITKITVNGQIFNQGAYTFINNVVIPTVSSADCLLAWAQAGDSIFILALNPSLIANLTVPSTATTPAGTACLCLALTSLFGDSNASGHWVVAGGDQGFVYNTATGQLGYGGTGPTSTTPSTSALYPLLALTGPITVLKLVNGAPVIDASGHYETTTVSWADPATVATLFTNGQGDPSPL